MSDPDYDEYYDESDECWECSGEGGWNSCMEDCCMAEGGEEGCTDPRCWRRCPNCRGKGFIEPAVGDQQPELREVLAEALAATEPHPGQTQNEHPSMTPETTSAPGEKLESDQ